MRTVVAVVALVVCVHAGLWSLLQRQQAVANIDAPLASVSYSPYARSQHPDNGDRPTPEQIRADLKTPQPVHPHHPYLQFDWRQLSSYPAIAAEFGLKVTLGIWIDKNEDRNEREIQAALALARRYSNINAIVVGNETMLRADKSVDELIGIIQRVKRQSPVPVTTGETLDVWLGISDPKKPEEAGSKAEAATKLASAVDFIAAHILPYWGGIPAEQAVEQTIVTYNQLRARHPGKRIVIAEFGWPSGGYNMHAADPGRIEQAAVLRDFVSRAEAYGIDYNIIEAFDQPWKTNEGGVGMYWGMFDASRHAKFSWVGPVTIRTIGSSPVSPFCLVCCCRCRSWRAAVPRSARRSRLRSRPTSVGAWFAIVFAFWQTHYFVLGAAFALGFGIVLLIPLVLIALARIEEIAAIAFGRGPRRLIAAPLPAPDGFAPKVSIHIPAYREPPEMLKATLDAVARLEYPNFECVVVINNTPDPAFWRPIEEHCRTLGDRFKFINEDNVAGYKAGALRLALAHTAADAEIIGVIDADYMVRPDWLKDLVPAFADPKVGMVQAPQDHRDGDRTIMHHAMNGEYAGFFDIGMVQRNEANAIIVHGTMCLIRRAAIDAAGGWSSDTIVEDYRSRLARSRAWLADPLHQPPLRARAAARHLRGLQEAAPSLGLWRLPDPAEALAPSAARRARADARAEARIRARLAQLAGRGSDRRGGRDPQSALGAGRRVRRHRHSGQDPHDADPRGFRGDVRAFRRTLSDAGGRPVRSDDGRRGRRHVGAVDGRARRRLRHMEGEPSIHAHRQGRRDSQGPGLSGLLGGGAGGAAADRRRARGGDQLQADPRDQHFCAGAGGAEPAVHCCGGDWRP